MESSSSMTSTTGWFCHARMLPSAGRVDSAARDQSARRRKPRRRRAARATLVSERLYVTGLVVPGVALLIALIGLHAPGGIDLAPDAPPTFDAERALGAGLERSPTSPIAVPAARPRRWPRRSSGRRSSTPARNRRWTPSATALETAGRSRCRTSRRCCGARRTRRSSSSPTATTCRRAPISRPARSARRRWSSWRRPLPTSGTRAPWCSRPWTAVRAGDAGARRLLANLPRGLNAGGRDRGAGHRAAGADPGRRSRRQPWAGPPPASPRASTTCSRRPPAAPSRGRASCTSSCSSSCRRATPGGQAPFVQRAIPSITIGDDPRAASDCVPRSPTASRIPRRPSTTSCSRSTRAPRRPGRAGSTSAPGRRVLSGWVLALLAVALLVPPAMVAVDLDGAGDAGAAAAAGRADARSRASRCRSPAPRSARCVAGLVGAAPHSPAAYPFAGTGSGVGIAAGAARAARRRRRRRRERPRAAARRRSRPIPPCARSSGSRPRSRAAAPARRWRRWRCRRRACCSCRRSTCGCCSSGSRAAGRPCACWRSCCRS